MGPGPRPSGDLIIAGQRFHTDAPIVNWTEGPQWDATSEYCKITQTDQDALTKCRTDPKTGKQFPYGPLPIPYTQRYATRPMLRTSAFAGGMRPSLEAVKAVIKQFVIHHDGCSSADMCFSVLQNERGLSVHFLLDNDGTIYQTIDLALMAYHASEWNVQSIGVEMCNRGDAFKEPNYYDSGKNGPKRDIVPCTINGHTIRAFAYTAAQINSLIHLSRALVRLLPNLPAEYPQSSPGQQSWATLPLASSFAFSGFIGHYHLWDQKWDPGPFDFKALCSKLRGQFCFPVFPRRLQTAAAGGANTPTAPSPSADDKPVVPTRTDELQAAAKALYASNEGRADGGFFPVGPWGDTGRLWHGGIHLMGKSGDGVFAPFPGRLIAARMGAGDTTVGSVNFILLRHVMSMGSSRIVFYSLYMHMFDDGGSKKAPDWMTRANSAWPTKSKGMDGKVVLLDEPIEAGDRIGRIGTAGPGDYAKPQLHLEFFAITELFTDVPSSPWQLVDGTAGGRFCEAPEITSIIDSNKDGMLSREEVARFFASDAAQQLHYMVTLNVSEWTPEPSWADALKASKDNRALTPKQIEQMVAEQITPGLWWTPDVAKHCKLPADGVVFHYHPVTFLAWFNQKLVDAQAVAVREGKADVSQASEVPKGIMGDYDDKLGTSMRSSGAGGDDPCNAQITFTDLVRGFETPDCETP